MEPEELELTPGAPGEVRTDTEGSTAATSCTLLLLLLLRFLLSSFSPSASKYVTSDRQVTMCEYIYRPFNECKGIYCMLSPYLLPEARCRDTQVTLGCPTSSRTTLESWPSHGWSDKPSKHSLSGVTRQASEESVLHTYRYLIPTSYSKKWP